MDAATAPELTTPQAPDFRLDSQTAFITGAGSGIGRAIAYAVAASGARVACFDLPGDGLDETAAAIKGSSGTAIALTGDVTDGASLVQAVARTETELGPLSLAVNSAGVTSNAPAEQMPLAQWQRVVDIDYTGVFLSCQAEANAMLAHGRGSIVNIASISGVIANRGLAQAHYNSSKAAVIHLSASLAMEWADRGVRVNSISPGYTRTPMNLRPEVTTQARQFEADTPMGRMATVEEIAGPTVFLLSDAAAFCTGVNLLVDGGFVCW